MAPKLVQLLRLEAIRLIKLQIEKLNQLTQIPNLLIADSKEAQSYDPDKVHNAISILEGELSKLEELDMVLAVVGTMKAGKSTTINAIVGLEVLPNRSTPMTALPTRIRHVPGQPEPRMQLAKVEPLNRVLHDLATQLAKPEQYKKIEHEERDLKSLADRIKVGMSFATNYQGQENIFSFLKELNDLVRLCKKLECEFPYGDYQNIADLPLIEVAFCHLNEQASNQGHFTLLDTPGPNEMGMPVLKKMMREQLQRASAVMLVMDATQLNSESDHEVRRELLKIADIAEDRLYVLVNKFDQMDRSFDQEQIQRLVSRNLLMGNKVPESHVFPVSAKFAYLAALAQHAVTHQRALPDYKQHDWVAEFGNAAFGWSWEDEIFNIEKVEQLTNQLWSKSNFYHALDKVVEKLRAKNNFLPHPSITSKILEQSKEMSNLVDIIKRTLNDDIIIISNNIKKNDDDERTFLTIVGNVYQGIYEIKDTVGVCINSMMKDRYHTQDVILRGIVEQINKKVEENQPYIESDDPNEMGFDTLEAANEFINSIFKLVQHTYQCMLDDISKSAGTLTLNLDELERLACNEVQIELSKLSVNSTTSAPLTNFNRPHFHYIQTSFKDQSKLNGMIKEKHRTVFVPKRQTGPWGDFCKAFEMYEYGWEQELKVKPSFHVNILTLRSNVDNYLLDEFKMLDDYIIREFSMISPHLKQYAEDFERFIVSLYRDRMNDMQKLNFNHKQKTEISEQISEIKATLCTVVQDSQELQQDCEKVSVECLGNN
ncbi:dynamin family protein [Aeromonas veronii]|uniref:dynamin family protein n=1 Tax=Aeromonas veronii TaxID=654 RepID=UPI00191F79A7|nr:dynamin family protein [Aeromonas veronii]MBL0593483.1 dynamin family protein [Aeromonas veronii]